MIKKQPYMNVGAAFLFVIFGLLFFILLYRYFSIEISGEAAGQPLAAKAQKNTQGGGHSKPPEGLYMIGTEKLLQKTQLRIHS